MKNWQISKLFCTAFLLYAIVFTGLVTTACPQPMPADIRKAIDASYRLPAATNDLIDTIREARDQNYVSLETSQKFGTYLYPMTIAEKAYVKGVKALKAATDKAGGTLDQGKFAELQIIFDDQIVKPFLEILQMVGVLSGDNSKKILFAIAAVRLLLTTIAGGLGSSLLQKLIGGISPGNRPVDLAGGVRLNWRYA